MKRIFILLTFSLYSNLNAMNETILNKALSDLSQALNDLHNVLSQKILLKESKNNFNEVIQKNQKFLKEYRKQLKVFKRNLATFVSVVQENPKNLILKEPLELKNLIQARNKLPTTEEISSVIESFNQFKNLSSHEVTSIIEFLNKLNYHLNDGVKQVRKIISKNIHIFEQNKIDLDNKIESVDQFFANTITTYFEYLDQYIVNDVLLKELDRWNESINNWVETLKKLTEKIRI